MTNTNAQPDGTFKIRAARFPELAHRVEVLNRRVRKTGGDGLDLVLDREEREEISVLNESGWPTGAKQIVRWAFVRVTGEVPRINGWAFLARIEHTDMGNIIARAPNAHDVALPLDLRTAPATCEHCRLTRRRNDTFVLGDSAGTVRRVGRNCLADFLRGGDPESALRLFSLLSAIESLLGEDDDGEGGYGSSRGDGVSTTWFIAATVSSIRQTGWASRKAAEERGIQSTASHALWISDAPPRDEQAREDWRKLQPTESDLEEAGEVVAWAAALRERPELDDYLHNLAVAASLGYVSSRNAGITASAVVARRKELDLEIERKRRALRPVAGHFGEVKKRYDFAALTVVFTVPLESDFGLKTLIGLEDAEGHLFKWFATGAHEYDRGALVRGKGTVKGHGEYKGRAETQLSRCVLETVETELAATG